MPNQIVVLTVEQVESYKWIAEQEGITTEILLHDTLVHYLDVKYNSMVDEKIKNEFEGISIDEKREKLDRLKV